MVLILSSGVEPWWDISWRQVESKVLVRVEIIDSVFGFIEA